MPTTVIRGISSIVTGRFETAADPSDTVVVTDGVIGAIGTYDDVRPSGPFDEWDAQGAELVPGLIDSHSHPVLGDYTPRQHMMGWTGAALNGGVTTLISAGETHWPGRVRTGVAAKAMTIAAHLSHRDFRPDGIKVEGGALLLEPGLTEADFDEMDAVGVHLLGEIGLGAIRDTPQLLELIGFARARGWVVPMHVGGASVPGSRVVDADLVLALQPDVASHVNGGPTARGIDEVEQIAEHTDAALEIVQAGNIRALADVVHLLDRRDELHRLQVGTDTPSGTGVIPLGMLRTLAYAAGLGGMDPRLAIACATGLTGDRYGLQRGRVEVGRPADLVVLTAPLGGRGTTAMDALALGDTPAVAGVFVDGVPLVTTSRVTPPPLRPMVRTTPSG